ncbi:MAG: type II secretion system protein GspG [Candidatus Aminicenantes bacterium]|nr:type II secretion system protein GspG [Candidatus Aminicenantes bacterium]
MRIRGFLVILLLGGIIVFLLWSLKSRESTQIQEEIQAFSEAKIKLTRANLSALERAVLNYVLQQGRLPSSLQEISRFAPLGITLEDAWGRRIKYEKLSADNFRLISAGPDGIFGTNDDLVQEN